MLRVVLDTDPEQSSTRVPELEQVVIGLDRGGACCRPENRGGETPTGNRTGLRARVRLNEGAPAAVTNTASRISVSLSRRSDHHAYRKPSGAGPIDPQRPTLHH